MRRHASGALPEPAFMTPAQFTQHRAESRARILGAIAFGAAEPPVDSPECPYAWIDMPVLDGDAAFEVWTSAEPVVREEAGGLVSARDADVLFGCLRVKLDCGLECRLDAATCLAYGRIFEFIDGRGYDHLLRVWNYVPDINGDAEGLERYQRFNVGRHEAFAAAGRVIGKDTPAACALGSRGNDMVIYFLAARQAGRLVENPRQTSAFEYPAQYGPRSPTFARAMLMQSADRPLLFVSGTSSIVGHQTLHAGDAAAQAAESIANVQAVIAHARSAGLDAAGVHADVLMKAYVRHACDGAMFRGLLTQAFGAGTRVLCLQADICRADLLVEVEAVCVGAAAAGTGAPARFITPAG
ncbi:MAG: hypothetical protein ABIS45_16820 [Burkholderiales bacterium]